MTGQVGILNVGAGDTKLSFDPAKPKEVARAKRIITDMLRKGFAIFVEVGKDEKGPLYRRAVSFDESTAEYLIVGDPEEETENVVTDQTPKTKGKSGKASRPTRRIAAEKTNAVAVSRTAGG